MHSKFDTLWDKEASMKKKYTAAAVFLGLLAISEAGGSAYFYKRTMKRNRVKMERTMKMAGTDWNQYSSGTGGAADGKGRGVR